MLAHVVGLGKGKSSTSSLELLMKTFKEFMKEAKDETEIGAHTGKLVPKKQLSAAKRHEFEKEEKRELKEKTWRRSW